MDHRLLEIIACPSCKGKLTYDVENQKLICKLDRLAYPIKGNIPVLLESEAQSIKMADDK